MATVTPNFNWPVPTSTDLVKDGATAIEALGDSIDASLVDLKGGTTGQVLSKTSGTDMDFTWVTSDDANAIQNSIVNAKGDLIGASANDTPAIISVGSNGETLVADSSTSTGLRYQSGYNGNGIINGGFDIWQRSTSATFAGTVTYPAADRWYGVSLGSSPTCTMSRQTADTTGLTYAMRFGRNSGQTATGDIYSGNTFESLDSKRFAGQTVTLSFYVKAGANAPTTLYSQIRTGTGTDQSAATLFSTGWTGGLNNSQTNTISTTMTRYSQTVTLGSTVNQIMVLFTYASTGTAGANEWIQVEGVQLELGSVATTFKRSNGAGGTIQGELAACQRYYQKSYGQSVTVPTNSSNTGAVYAISGNAANSNAISRIGLPVVMRAAPTIVIYSYTSSQTSRVSDAGGVDLTASSGVGLAIGDSGFSVQNTSGGTLTAAYGGFLFHYSASAEL